MTRIPFKPVSDAELRTRFNALGYETMLEAGQLVAFVERDALAQADWLPAGTRSQILHYYTPDLKSKVAIVHRYLRPDGTLGASGMPDPKQVLDDGVIYALQRQR